MFIARTLGAWKRAPRSITAVASSVATILILALMFVFFGRPSFSSQTAGSCNVFGVKVYGSIVSTKSGISATPRAAGEDGPISHGYTVARDIEDALGKAGADPSIKGIVIDIDSQGGGVVAGEEIALAIRRVKKPSVAVIHEAGLSSGYLAASAADAVFASANSAIGGIGASSSYLDDSEKKRREGYVYQQLSSSPFKDVLASGKSLTDEERAMIMRNVQTLHDHFVELVALYRGQSEDDVAKLADGSVMLGREALDFGLIDHIGGFPDAVQYLSHEIGEPVSLCW